MKVLVAYYSKTKNTEKLAQAIYDIIDADKDIKTIDKIDDVSAYDLIFIGFPVQAHSVPLPAQSFISRLPAGKHIAFFSTHGSLRGGQLPKQAFEHAFGLAAKVKVLGHFGSRGRVEASLIEALMQKPEHQGWAQEAQGAQGHPNESDLQDAQHFATSIMSKHSRVADHPESGH